MSSTTRSLQQPLLPLAHVGKEQQRGGSGGAPSTSFVVAASLCCFAYLASGVSQPLVMSAVKLAGLGDTGCQVYMVPYYLGMACTGCFGLFTPEAKWRDAELRKCVLAALLGAVAQNLNYAGNMLAGSGIFAVIYSSVSIWSAVFSRLLLHKVLSRAQWVAVCFVFFGLALAGAGAKDTGEHAFRGAIMVFAGAALHAFTHVLSEAVSSSGKVHPQVNCCIQGMTSLAVVVVWQLSYTLRPSIWDEKVVQPMANAGTLPGQAARLLAGVAIGNFIHAAAFFYLLAQLGAVSTSVLKGLQAVAVFGLSHILFCGHDPTQCMTGRKLASLLIVVTGVLAYTLATARQAKAEKKP